MPSPLQWVLEQALPEFVPGAMRRARRQLGTDPLLMTRSERAVRTRLTEFENEYLKRKEELLRELQEAETAASTIREGLLYGTGQQLVDVVRSVLASASIKVVDLDEQLGGTKNADLLCTYREHSRLVEVKSASGGPSERLYQDLLRHLREWPTLPGSRPVDGGALVINHEHRKLPLDRSQRPWERPEFLAAQTEPVISTMDLFGAWREDDANTIRRLLFGQLAVPDAVQVTFIDARTPQSPRRGWSRWRRP